MSTAQEGWRQGGWLHANALALGEKAVLVRGPSGAGKSRLTLSLLAAARARGRFARLIGDDRIHCSAAGGRLVVRGHPAIAGRIEAHGTGIITMEREEAGIVALVVDLAPPGDSDILPRLPEPHQAATEICGLSVTRLAVPGGTAFSAPETVQRVFSALEGE